MSKKVLGILHLTHEGYLCGLFCPGGLWHGGFVRGFMSGGLCPDTESGIRATAADISLLSSFLSFVGKVIVLERNS